VFMLGSTDRYLTFTLSGAALGYASGAPQDAFQVALLDASTGASLLSTTDGTTSQSTSPHVSSPLMEFDDKHREYRGACLWRKIQSGSQAE
jgi:hypothetical protein